MSVTKRPLVLLLCALAMIIMNNLANAQTLPSKQNLIDSVVAAYGGETLKNLRAIRIDDEFRETYPGQGHGLSYDDFWTIRAVTQLDLTNKLGSYETWAHQYGRILHFHTLSTDNGVAYIDYQEGLYRLQGEHSFYQGFGRDMRSSDTMLAYMLAEFQESATLHGFINYLGNAHYHIEFSMPASVPIHLYIDSETRYIARMHRTLEHAEIYYLYTDHQQQDGLTFARDYRFYIGSDLIFMTADRQITANMINSVEVTLSAALALEPARIEYEDLTVIPVADNLHHVGDNMFTSFYDAGDFIIAIGAYEGLPARFSAYQTEMEHQKPLQYMIITHHHDDHASAIPEALEMNAKLVLPGKIRARLQSRYGELPESQVVLFDDTLSLNGLSLYTISTVHSELNTVTYIESAKALYQADHYAGMFADQINRPSRNTFSFYQAVKPLGLDINHLISEHSGKVESWSDLVEELDGYRVEDCRFDRRICADINRR